LPRILGRSTAFTTDWFRVVAKETDVEDAPYYSLELPDYVSIVAITEARTFLMVKQFRPAIEAFTLELPSGTVEPGETPEQAARRELIEETGHEASELELLGTLYSDTGRLGNRLWGYLARPATAVPGRGGEAGLELVSCPPDRVLPLLRDGELPNALNVAVLMLLAARRGLETFAPVQPS